MDLHDLNELSEGLWAFVAAPLAGVAALVLTVRMGFPQVTKLAAAFRALRAHDEGADGTVPPATAVAFSSVAAYGAAAAVGSATAVSLGGAGAVAWVWLFALLLAPLRMAETALARTSPPGRPGEATGSLAGRLLGDPVGGLRVLGWLLLVLVPLTGFAYFGGTSGEAVLEAAGQLLPGSAVPLGVLVAVAGAALALAPTEKTGTALGWVAAVALIAMFGAALVAFLSEPGRGFGGFGRAAIEAMRDAPRAGAFAGALAGEIAMAAVLHVLPPLASTGGVDGALHSEAQAKTTKAQAASALLGPLFYGLLTTVVGLSLIATNAFSRQTEDTRTLDEITFYRVGFDTLSQRLETGEASRRLTGFIRISEGTAGIVEINAATDRGMMRAATFEDDGEPADLALHVVDGRVDGIQSPAEMGVLTNRPMEDLQRIVVRGQMLPRGGRLLAVSMTRGGSDITSRVALAALLLLAVLGAVAWGLGLRKTLSARVPEKIARFAAVIPALGLGLAASSVIPRFGAMGLAVAALLTSVTSIALILRGKDAAAITATGARSLVESAASTKSDADADVPSVRSKSRASRPKRKPK